MSKKSVAAPDRATDGPQAVTPTEAVDETLLDDPQEWPSFGRACAPADGGGAPAGAWESHVVIQGMHCAACALTVEEALRSVPGVRSAEVSAASQRARVVWQPGQTLPSHWMAALRRAGYRALPALDAHARGARQRENRQALWRWLVAGFCMMQVMMYAWPAYVADPGDLSMEMERLLRWASWVISLPVVFFACGPFFSNALRDIRQRSVSMDLPVALGMAITFAVSTAGTFEPEGVFGREVYFDSLTMFVFFLLTGRWLELRLRDRTAGALEAVLNRLPDSVLRRQADGAFERVAVRRLQPGDVVRVLPGEAFAADGQVLEGHTLADEALLTGESTPVRRGPGTRVVAGSYNLQAPVLVQVQGVGQDTRFAQIVALMESAATQKPRLAQLADRIARPFLVLVLLAALLAAAWWWPTDPAHALMVAVAVLVVTCPCALSLATPVAMLSAAGALARSGVLVRNLQALESLSQVDTVVFDKTGTLTRDGMAVQALQPAAAGQERQVLGMAAALAQHSLHPASRAILRLAQEQGVQGEWVAQDVQEEPGRGLRAQVWQADGTGPAWTLRLGSARHAGLDAGAAPADGPQVFLAATDGQGTARELARFALAEDVRAQTPQAVAALRSAGLDVHLLSGDRSAAVQRLAGQAGIAHWQGDCSPDDKLRALRALQAQGRRVAMVGDGLNDGPVLAAAHASFAFGRSVPLAQARADFVVPGEDLGQVVRAIALARQALKVVRQNLWWAAAYNAACVPLAIAGYMPAWLAGLGMALSSLLVILNAARLSVTPQGAAALLPASVRILHSPAISA
ncbi:heavy metal translocating P-type ATPase [Comamonas granuli]|uniref:heavy metal translocating P-type ATPase n=1 Tax=Comamonas granuli TaxID=290309 RepID=UPI000A0698CE|nr:cation-translocating P-type ATPase [Comamonas granuli]